MRDQKEKKSRDAKILANKNIRNDTLQLNQRSDAELSDADTDQRHQKTLRDFNFRTPKKPKSKKPGKKGSHQNSDDSKESEEEEIKIISEDSTNDVVPEEPQQEQPAATPLTATDDTDNNQSTGSRSSSKTRRNELLSRTSQVYELAVSLTTASDEEQTIILQSIHKSLKKLDNIYVNQAQKIQAAQEQMQQQHQEFAHIRDNVASKEDLEKIVTRLTYHNNQMLGDIRHQIIDSARQITNDLAQGNNNTQALKEPTPTPTTQQPTYSSILENPAEHTLVVKPTTNVVQGQSITQVLETEKIQLPVSSVTKVITNKAELEIVCQSAQSKEATRKALLENPALQSKFTINDKPTPQMKLIALAVPQHLSEDYVNQTIVEAFKLSKENIKILTPQKARNTTLNNWIFLAELHIAKLIVSGEGTYFSHRYCRIRPHTNISLCKKCQRIGHNTVKCQFKEVCSICCKEHNQQGECPNKNSKRCINCHTSNTKYSTKHPTFHAPGWSQCPSYLAAYGRERRRLDSLFDLKKEDPASQQKKPSPQQAPANRPQQAAPRRQPPQQQPSTSQDNEDTREEEDEEENRDTAPLDHICRPNCMICRAKKDAISACKGVEELQKQQRQEELRKSVLQPQYKDCFKQVSNKKKQPKTRSQSSSVGRASGSRSRFGRSN